MDAQTAALVLGVVVAILNSINLELARRHVSNLASLQKLLEDCLAGVTPPPIKPPEPTAAG